MIKAAIFLTDGFEDIEAISVIDLLRRAHISVDTVSVFNQDEVISSHQITVKPDIMINQCLFHTYDILVLPGGPGSKKYTDSKLLVQGLKEHHHRQKWIAAICAAPLALYKMGILTNECITCYPSVKNEMLESQLELSDLAVVVDKHIITGQAAGSTFLFALTIIEILTDRILANKIKSDTLYSN